MSNSRVFSKWVTFVLLVLFTLLNAFHYEIYHSSCKSCDLGKENNGQYGAMPGMGFPSRIDLDSQCPFCTGMETTIAQGELDSSAVLIQKVQPLSSSFSEQNFQINNLERAPPAL